jgi:hypothetical protein
MIRSLFLLLDDKVLQLMRRVKTMQAAAGAGDV